MRQQRPIVVWRHIAWVMQGVGTLRKRRHSRGPMIRIWGSTMIRVDSRSEPVCVNTRRMRVPAARHGLCVMLVLHLVVVSQCSTGSGGPQSPRSSMRHLLRELISITSIEGARHSH